jgi:hypothetical protein
VTAADPRLGEIEARLTADVAAYNDHGFIGDNQCMTDRDYLLTELRKRDDALARVEALHQPVDAAMYAGNGVHKVKVCTGCGRDDGNWQRWPCPTRAAVTAAKGDGE